MRGSIVKRGNSFAAVIYLGRDPDTGKERHRWFSFRTRREAEAHLVHFIGQLSSGGVIPSTKSGVGEYLEQWLKDYAQGRLAQTTLESYRATLRVHVIPALGHIPLSRLSPQAIQSYLTKKLQQGLSSTTVRYHAAVLHEALRHAVK